MSAGRVKEGMTLSDFLRTKCMTVTALAAAMHRPISTVHGWVTGRRRPDWSDIPDIELATGRLVTADDFVPRNPPFGAEPCETAKVIERGAKTR